MKMSKHPIFQRGVQIQVTCCAIIFKNRKPEVRAFSIADEVGLNRRVFFWRWPCIRFVLLYDRFPVSLASTNEFTYIYVVVESFQQVHICDSWTIVAI